MAHNYYCRNSWQWHTQWCVLPRDSMTDCTCRIWTLYSNELELFCRCHIWTSWTSCKICFLNPETTCANILNECHIIVYDQLHCNCKQKYIKCMSDLLVGRSWLSRRPSHLSLRRLYTYDCKQLWSFSFALKVNGIFTLGWERRLDEGETNWYQIEKKSPFTN